MKTLDIAFNLYEHYGQVEEIKAYYGLLAQYGYVQAAFESKDEKRLEYIRDVLAKYPDHVEHPSYNFIAYKYGGNAQAWAMYNGVVKDPNHRLAEFADQMIAQPQDANGIMCHPRDPAAEKIWIDSVSIICPYMLLAGLVCNKQEYIDFAVNQYLGHSEVLMDHSCGLLHQCRGFMSTKEQISEDHWSRGNGWAYVGLAALLEYLPKDHPKWEKVLQLFCELSDAVLPYQADSGLWRQEMTVEEAWVESSGTALILLGLGAGMRLGYLQDEKYRLAFEKGMEGLIRDCINDDFSTEHSCQGCLCAGLDERKGTIAGYIQDKKSWRDEPHSFGSFMLALVEAHRNGYTEVCWEKRTLK